jgi:diacylglycerol diphosphate phosphatase/phosphatidate phosphatase
MTYSRRVRADTIQQHQAHDLVFGMIIGLVIGTLAYRSAYTAVFDFHFNHIPLLPYAIRMQPSRYVHYCHETRAKGGKHQVAESDEVDYKDWPKNFEPKNEEREEGMAWMESIKSVRWASRELELETNPRMRKSS